MKKLAVAVLFVLCAVLLQTQSAAQDINASDVLTNESILGLVKDRVNDEIVIDMLNTQQCNCSISPPFLITLKKAGASDNLVRAVYAVHKRGGKPIKQSAETTIVTAEAVRSHPIGTIDEQQTRQAPIGSVEEYYPSTSGVFYKSPAGLVPLEKVNVPGIKTDNGLKMGLKALAWKRNSSKYSFSGREAPVKVVTSPEFYVKGLGLSPRQIEVIELDQKKDERQLEYSGFGMLSGMQTGPRKDKFRPTIIERKSDDVLIIRFERPLLSGEYIIFVEGAPGYDFSVDDASLVSRN